MGLIVSWNQQDELQEVKDINDTKIGVNGLSDSGITTIDCKTPQEKKYQTLNQHPRPLEFP